jgi:hypothetical protein
MTSIGERPLKRKSHGSEGLMGCPWEISCGERCEVIERKTREIIVKGARVAGVD